MKNFEKNSIDKQINAPAIYQHLIRTTMVAKQIFSHVTTAVNTTMDLEIHLLQHYFYKLFLIMLVPSTYLRTEYLDDKLGALILSFTSDHLSKLIDCMKVLCQEIHGQTDADNSHHDTEIFKALMSRDNAEFNGAMQTKKDLFNDSKKYITMTEIKNVALQE